MDELLHCIEKYFNGELSAEQFSYEFPSIYLFYMHEGNIDEQYVDALDDISEACGWYEPNPLHRQDDDGYIGEEELREIILEKYQWLKST
ncbi:hypothetical protein HNQ82_001892 [Anoxybacillus tengchongensis]|uniref:Colicin D immunity protein domain-containing protein n=1 Tax=Anoxybacillus tengchongensis TaxID=576944 RepID=A0A7W9YSW2_9BACL|nr:hypothetical protein [Anoxybacillus tengchongensis]MBB6177061.1 hypothetical protein [Anoxybacillus tengchongensis]